MPPKLSCPDSVIVRGLRGAAAGQGHVFDDGRDLTVADSCSGSVNFCAIETYKPPNAKWTDNCDEDKEVEATHKSPAYTECGGTISYMYAASEDSCGNPSNDLSLTVTVAQASNIGYQVNQPESVECNGEVTLSYYPVICGTVGDATDGPTTQAPSACSISEEVTFEVNSLCRDGTTELSVTIESKDTTPPTLKPCDGDCPEDGMISYCENAPTFPKLFYEDNCQDDIEISPERSGEKGDECEGGQFIYTYGTPTDGCENMADETMGPFTVTVQPGEAVYNLKDPPTTAECGSSVSWSVTKTLCGNVIDPFASGVHDPTTTCGTEEVPYSYTPTCGSVVLEDFEVDVTDSDSPVLTCGGADPCPSDLTMCDIPEGYDFGQVCATDCQWTGEKCVDTATPDINVCTGGTHELKWTLSEDGCGNDGPSHSATLTIPAQAPIDITIESDGYACGDVPSFCIKVPICAAGGTTTTEYCGDDIAANGFELTFNETELAAFPDPAECVDGESPVKTLTVTVVDQSTGCSLEKTLQVPTNCCCETSWALGETCFTYPTPTGLGLSRWGWSIGPLTATDTLTLAGTYEVYAGAAKCDTDKGQLSGTVKVSLSDTTLVIDVDPAKGFTYTAMQVWWGNDYLPTKKNGGYNAAPGQLGFVDDDGTVASSYNLPYKTYWKDLDTTEESYVAIHFDTYGTCN